ncbi:MAG: GTP-binding protein, partial [Pseudomonadales bacterium]|nr:GTP-binding protein [Pseudomonadales bacterium]
IFVLDEVKNGLADLVLGARMRGARPNPVSRSHDYDGFSAVVIAAEQPVAADAFFALMDRIPASIYRIKGTVAVKERRQFQYYSFQAAGSHWRVEPSADKSGTTQLIVIGQKDDAEFAEFCIALNHLAGHSQAATRTGNEPG